MNRSRRVLICALPLLSVSTACGSVSSTSTAPTGPAATSVSASLTDAGGSGPAPTPAGSLPVIHLGVAGGGAFEVASAPSASGSAVDSRMSVAPGSIVYAFAGNLPEQPSTGPTWSMPAHQQLDDARVTAIAAAFGATGSVDRLPADQGGGWQVGTQDGMTANLTVVDDGSLSWYFNPVMSMTGSSTSCAGDPVPERSSSTAPVVACLEPSAPTPPVGVPTKEEALAKAEQIVAAAGIDLAGQTLVATADEWSASVTGTLELAGHRTQMTTQIFFGANGAVTAASGFLATPVAGADYPLVTPEEALQRLNSRDDAWMTQVGGVGVSARGGAPVTATDPPSPSTGCAPMIDAVGTARETSPAAASSAATIETAAVAVAPVPSDALMCPQAEVGNDGSAAGSSDPAIGGPAVEVPATTAEQILVALTGVRLDVDPVYSSDGTVWLLPTYVFTSGDAGEFTVVAVGDQYLHDDGA